MTAVHFTRVRTLQNLARVEGRGKTVESLKRQTKDTISVEMSGGRVEMRTKRHADNAHCTSFHMDHPGCRVDY